MAWRAIRFLRCPLTHRKFCEQLSVGPRLRCIALNHYPPADTDGTPSAPHVRTRHGHRPPGASRFRQIGQGPRDTLPSTHDSRYDLRHTRESSREAKLRATRPVSGTAPLSHMMVD